MLHGTSGDSGDVEMEAPGLLLPGLSVHAPYFHHRRGAWWQRVKSLVTSYMYCIYTNDIYCAGKKLIQIQPADLAYHPFKDALTATTVEL